MWKLRKLAQIITSKRNIHTATQLTQIGCNSFDISEEVNHGLHSGAPIVALESTIITHGMPYPDNLQCALDVERIVREQGAIPATIAVLGGKVTVGLNHAQIATLADTAVNKSVKTSRRDFPYVVSEKLNGGTTVSGTIIVASQVGIPVFVTGGIGGVHRQGENTLDISADLTELGRNSIAVVSSGVKSILDIPRTLEYLETQGVFVATYGETCDFPAFYSRKSGSYAPYNVTSAQQAAKIIKANLELDLKSAMLFAVPVPEAEALDDELLEKAIAKALAEAEVKGICGKHITPFLLSAVAKITGGRSLQTNMALIKNNAKVGGEIAVELSRIRAQEETIVAAASSEIVSPVVIGGCVLDLCASLTVPDILLDGSMHYTKFSMSPGGVARNICEALGKLGAQPHLLSAVGNDSHGRYLRANLPAASTRALVMVDSCPSAQCTVVLDSNGECKLLLGEMDIHKHITPDIIMSQSELLKRCPLIVTDGNLGTEALACVLEMADKYGRPVFYEPTDIPVAAAPFSLANYRALKYISPNLNELRIIAQSLGVVVPTASTDLLSEAAQLGRLVAEYIDTIFITLGARGLMVVRKGTARDPLHGSTCHGAVRVRHYKATEITQLVNVSGAGDCLASGIIVAMLAGLPESVCVSVGFAAAQMALQSRSAVPSVLFNKNHVSWTQAAPYTEL